MGASAGGSRVIAVSAARDLYVGRQMAKVMSLVMIVFMSAPIVAPFFGQLMLKVMTWHGIFWVLAVFGVIMFAWVLVRMPETLPLDRRVPLNIPTMLRNYWKVIRTREALGYTIASGFLFGGLMSYISSSEQLYHEVYDTGDWFALWFAGAAIAMSVSNLINSRLVERIGMRPISHFALICFRDRQHRARRYRDAGTRAVPTVLHAGDPRLLLHRLPGSELQRHRDGAARRARRAPAPP